MNPLDIPTNMQVSFLKGEKQIENYVPDFCGKNELESNSFLKQDRKPHGYLSQIRSERDSSSSSQEARDNDGTQKTRKTRSFRGYLFERKSGRHLGHLGFRQRQDSYLLRDNEQRNGRKYRKEKVNLPRGSSHNKNKSLEAGCKPTMKPFFSYPVLAFAFITFFYSDHREASL